MKLFSVYYVQFLSIIHFTSFKVDDALKVYEDEMTLQARVMPQKVGTLQVIVFTNLIDVVGVVTIVADIFH